MKLQGKSGKVVAMFSRRQLTLVSATVTLTLREQVPSGPLKCDAIIVVHSPKPPAPTTNMLHLPKKKVMNTSYLLNSMILYIILCVLLIATTIISINIQKYIFRSIKIPRVRSNTHSPLRCSQSEM